MRGTSLSLSSLSGFSGPNPVGSQQLSTLQVARLIPQSIAAGAGWTRSENSEGHTKSAQEVRFSDAAPVFGSPLSTSEFVIVSVIEVTAGVVLSSSMMGSKGSPGSIESLDGAQHVESKHP